MGRGQSAWVKTGKRPTTYWCSETPFQILDQRYAKGDITKDQYEQMKRDIESDSQRPGPEDGS
jgi:uncharacterized membrane protein